MTPANLSAFWNDIAPALGNHLWQSTVFAAAAGLLTLILRKNHARARYWLWLAASLKFLIPFSLLVSLGSHLAWSHSSPASSGGGLYVAVEQISQPFTQTAIVMPIISRASTTAAQSLFHLLPTLLVATWLCGFAFVVLIWCIRWRKISVALRDASPLREGREAEAVRRLQHVAGTRTPIDLVLSQTSLEPGIFGITRPTLVWPEGISKHLEDAHLEAILAHEVWHVRRRDNLAAAVHMFVEALFWFHPLVWWLGARLVEERERACDEEVVELGGQRHIYAESILKVCEFCVGSPLPCVSGVTGADLKKRMVHIMNDRILHNLGLARKILLSVAAALAIALPVTFGLFNATLSRAQEQTETATSSTPIYSSVSIKPSALANGDKRTKIMFSLMDGSFVANGVTLETLIQLAYHIQGAQISGPQDFLNKTKFDIEAKLAPQYVQQMSEHKGGEDQGMLRRILTDQFKLAVHSEARTLPAYDLVIDENGAKLQPSGNEPHMIHLGRGELTSSGAPLELLAAQLSARLGRPVVDKTGFNGNYAFNLHWTPDPSEEENLKQSGELVASEPAADSNGPSLLTALQEQFGLKLQSQTEPVQVLVIDHAEQPSAN